MSKYTISFQIKPVKSVQANWRIFIFALSELMGRIQQLEEEWHLVFNLLFRLRKLCRRVVRRPAVLPLLRYHRNSVHAFRPGGRGPDLLQPSRGNGEREKEKASRLLEKFSRIFKSEPARIWKSEFPTVSARRMFDFAWLLCGKCSCIIVISEKKLEKVSRKFLVKNIFRWIVS